MPYWASLKKRVKDGGAPGSRVLIDNTALQNAWSLMSQGLGDPKSGQAMHLLDLSALFAALTHFDRAIVLAHKTGWSAVSAIEPVIGGPASVIDWGAEQRLDPDLEDDLFRKFNSIQNAFFERQQLRQEWMELWKRVWGREIRPMRFWTGELDRLIDSPSHPLNPQAAAFETVEYSAAGEVAGYESDAQGWIRFSGSLEPIERLWALLSYHTYRSIFYLRLSDYLRSTYAACGIRTPLSDLLAHRLLTETFDLLNPSLPFNLNVWRRCGPKLSTVIRPPSRFRLWEYSLC